MQRRNLLKVPVIGSFTLGLLKSFSRETFAVFQYHSKQYICSHLVIKIV